MDIELKIYITYISRELKEHLFKELKEILHDREAIFVNRWLYSYRGVLLIINNKLLIEDVYRKLHPINSLNDLLVFLNTKKTSEIYIDNIVLDELFIMQNGSYSLEKEIEIINHMNKYRENHIRKDKNDIFDYYKK